MTSELRPQDLLIEGHGFSTVKGFRLEDFKIECPFVEGRLCPEKIEIVSEQTAHIKKAKNDRELTDDAELSREECIEQLRDFNMKVREDGCADALETYCPSAETIEQSESISYTSLAKLAARRIFVALGLVEG